MGQDMLRKMKVGAVAGVTGTLALQGAMLGIMQVRPRWETPQSSDPADFMLWQAERHLPQKVWFKIPRKVEKGAGIMLSVGYGATFGALYGAVRSEAQLAWLEGAALGAAVWAIGYLGWLPLARLTPPVWRQELRQVIGPAVEHVVYGVVTVMAYEYLRGKW